MSSQFIPGVGLIHIDSNKSKDEQQATIDYWKSITPKQKELTFATGFSDVQSIIWRAGETIFNTDDEEKNKWFKDQVKEFGQNVGYYDSLALEKYYSDVVDARPLTKEEEITRAGNMALMQEFQRDMYEAYDNRSGDTTGVQKKYGYSPEDISVLDGLVTMMQNPGYSAGMLTGMIVKDPELILIDLLRIPEMAARGINAARAAAGTIKAAGKVRPKYVKRFVHNR